jgi:hypothetical protein
MSLQRSFLDMNALVEKWDSLGSKTLPKPLNTKGHKNVLTGPKKGLTTSEEVARAARAVANKLKGEEEE